MSAKRALNAQITFLVILAGCAALLVVGHLAGIGVGRLLIPCFFLANAAHT